MEKDRQTLSATELSKFTYCPYQWYYEREFGRKELRRMAKERNELLNIEDSRDDRFSDGIKWHSHIHFKQKLMRVLWVSLFLLAILAAICVLSGLVSGGV